MKWRATDLIDFEYLLGERAGENPDNTREDTDRKIYQAFIGNHPEPVIRKDLFRYWLSRQREGFRQSSGGRAVLPGEAAAEALGLSRWLAGILGALLGAGLCGSLLAYSGNDPINIFSCLWVMIAPQLVLLMLLGLSSLLRAIGPKKPPGGVYPLLTGIFRRLIKKLITGRYSGLSAARGERMASITGMIGQSRSIYGAILFRPLFIVGQVFGVFFNIGIIGFLLLRIAITDLAFGWQSTLQPAAETVYRVVDTIALPWSWVAPDAIAHPTLSQIEGSQFVLKESMQGLSTSDLTAWWPFLLFAVICYGLLPRLILLAGSVIRQGRAIHRLSFSHAACDRLLLSMKTPAVTTKSRAYEKADDERSETAAAPFRYGPSASEEMPEDALKTTIILIPEDIAGKYRQDELEERLRRRLGLGIGARIVCRFDPKADAQAVEETLKGDSGASENRLVFIQEAWQPPIQETLSWIVSIRQKAGVESGFIIGLIGKPSAETIFTPPADTDRMVWAHAVAKQGDPYLRVEVLGG